MARSTVDLTQFITILVLNGLPFIAGKQVQRLRYYRLKRKAAALQILLKRQPNSILFQLLEIWTA
jgi:hypothetical protein